MLANPQLVAAMRHPDRAHAMTVLAERVASASEIAKELGKTTKHVAYHIKELLRFGVIELVREEESAGGRTISKYYRALDRSWFDPASWEQVESKHQPGITAGVLAACNSDLAKAVQSGTIHRPDNHLSRTVLLVDPMGYRELVDHLDVVLPQVVELQGRAAARMTRKEPVLARAHIIQFPSLEAGGPMASIITAPPTDVQPPEISDSAVLSALEHETRVHALMILNERPASAAEIAREIDREPRHVAYHLRRLLELGLVEELEVVETSGGRLTGRYYWARIRPWFDPKVWEQVDPKRQRVITCVILGMCNADIADAVRTGTIDDPDSHISRTPMVLDREGYDELERMFDEVIVDILLIQDRSRQRILDGAARIATKVHLYLFECPDPGAD